MIRATKDKLVSPLIVALSLMSGCDSQGKTANLSYPEPDSSGARILLENCGLCHAAPLPASHGANTWPSIVQRMQMRMTSKGQRALPPEEAAILLDYLQRHAGASEK
jgi:cytochrome c5